MRWFALDELTKNRLQTCMDNRRPYEQEIRPGVVVMVEPAGGPWGQPMVCGAVISFPGGLCRKWCRSVAELEEFLEGKDEYHDE